MREKSKPPRLPVPGEEFQIRRMQPRKGQRSALEPGEVGIDRLIVEVLGDLIGDEQTAIIVERNQPLTWNFTSRQCRRWLRDQVRLYFVLQDAGSLADAVLAARPAGEE